MMSIPRHRMVVWGAAGVLAAAGWVAGACPASPFNLAAPTDHTRLGPLATAGGPDTCGDNDHFERQGGSSGTVAKVCQGSGPVVIGAAVGQMATVTGPTVTGPAQVRSIVATGDAIMGDSGGGLGV
jgi:hypothetical protein